MGNKSQRKRKPKEGFQLCPKCETVMPNHIVGCWSCGYTLDKHIRELGEAENESKGNMAEDS